MTLHVGDSVVVKSGVLDTDFGIDISGWQGRIKEFDDETVFIRWDSITLREMGLGLIIRCENGNLDWRVMTLDIDDIDVTMARDSKADVSSVASQLMGKMQGDPRLIDDQSAQELPAVIFAMGF